MRSWGSPCLLLLLWLAAGFVPDGEWVRVERVVDGDTVVLSGLGRARLLGVDTPETVQPGQAVERYGPEATAFARATLEGEPVRVEYEGRLRDDHGRLLVYLYLQDGRMFNRMLLEGGYAYALTRYPFGRRFEFLALEDAARRERRGLWAGALSGPYSGNSRSRVYHAPGCEQYRCANCRESFAGREGAERAGYRAHWDCVGSQ